MIPDGKYWLLESGDIMQEGDLYDENYGMWGFDGKPKYAPIKSDNKAIGLRWNGNWLPMRRIRKKKIG